MNPDVSIIVPMYNVEVYLPKCVDSILNQTHRNIEVILVDDESPDSCGEIAEAYKKKDSRVKVIHQKNKWLGGARNSGLKIAQGTYILFVDSDDYIREDMCEKLLTHIGKHDVDMVFFDMYHVDRHGNIISTSSSPIDPNIVYQGTSGRSVLYDLIIRTHAINSACQKLYRRTLLTDNHLFFNEEIRYAEDYEFCLRLFPMVASYVHFDQPLYYYVQNDESIMNKADPEIVNKFIILFKYREQFIAKQGLETEKNRKASAMLLCNMIVKSLPKYFAGRHIGEKIRAINSIANDPSVQVAINRFHINESPLGRYGKIILYSLKNKNALLTLLAYQVLRK